MKTDEKEIARIFSDIGGYYICDERLDYLDCRGQAYQTKAGAIRTAWEGGYTHAIGSGTYWDGVKKIPSNLRGWY